MKKILLGTLISLGLVGSGSVNAMQAQGRATTTTTRTTDAEKLDAQKKVFISTFMTLGLSFLVGKDAFKTTTEGIATTLTTSGNPVGNFLGKIAGGLVCKLAEEVERPTEKSLAVVTKTYEALAAKVKVAHRNTGSIPADLQAQYDEAKRQKINMELALYTPEFTVLNLEIEEMEKQVTAKEQRVALIETTIPLNVASLQTKKAQVASPATLGRAKIKLAQEIAELEQENKDYAIECGELKAEIPLLKKELEEQSAEDQKSKPSKLTVWTELGAKVESAKDEAALLPQPVQLKTKQENDEKVAGLAYLERIVSGSATTAVAQDDGAVNAAKVAESALDPMFKADLKLLVSFFESVAARFIDKKV